MHFGERSENCCDLAASHIQLLAMLLQYCIVTTYVLEILPTLDYVPISKHWYQCVGVTSEICPDTLAIILTKYCLVLGYYHEPCTRTHVVYLHE